MADSEKKKRKSKEASAVAEPTEVAVEAPVEDAVSKSKKKSKRAVVEASEEAPEVVSQENEAKKGEKLSEPSAEVAVEPSAPVSVESDAPVKRKSKKSVKEPVEASDATGEAHVEAVAPAQDEKAAREEEVPEKKSKKRDAAKADGDAVVAEPSPSKEGSEAKTEPAVPKRRQSMIGKFFDKLLGKGDSKDKSKPKSDPKEQVAEAPPAKTEEVAPVEAATEEAPRKKKKKKASASDEAAAEEEVAHVDGDEEAHEEHVEEEHVALAPPPKFPPPSAPRKAPAGPVKEQLGVGSVFSMKAQIKVEVDAADVAVEYSNEEVKREIDFAHFCANKPQYSVGAELSETAYNRTFAAKSTQHPEEIIVKFYSNEPPRLIPQATIAAQVDLVRTLAKSNAHILPILDEFVGDAYVDPTKHNAKAAKTDETKDSESAPHVDAETTPAAAEQETAPVEGKKKKKKETTTEEVEKPAQEKEAAHTDENGAEAEAGKKKKKKKNADGKEGEEKNAKEEEAKEEKAVRPEPKIAVVPPPKAAGSDATAPGASSSQSQQAHADEHDYYLVYEALPDVIHFIRNSESSDQSFTEKRVSIIIAGILKALDSLHASGFMHRAVAPANIVVNKDGDSLLTGFDMCCKIEEPRGNVMTSEKFKAPEITHAPKHDQTVDLWGIGTVTYFLLTGRQVFRETNNARLKIAIRDATVEYDPQDWDHISPDAQAFCKALIVKDPAARLTVKAALEHPWIANAPETVLANAVAHLKE